MAAAGDSHRWEGVHACKPETASGVLGDPSTASKEKGEKIFRLAVEALADFLCHFHGWDEWEDAPLGT